MVPYMKRRPFQFTSWLIVLMLWLPAGCASQSKSTKTTAAAPPADLFKPGPGRVVLSVQELDCMSCGKKVVNAVKAVDGVTAAEFVGDRVEVGVAFDEAKTNTDALLAAARATGYGITLGAGQGKYASPVVHPDDYDVQVISRGEEVNLAEHLVAGKVTVVDFYADWCGPCRRVAVVMNMIMSERPDVALRKIDIVDWDTPVTKQHMSDVANLPYTVVYDRAGNLVRRIVGLDIAGLNAAVEEASK